SISVAQLDCCSWEGGNDGEVSMELALFGISALMSLLGAATLATVVWPRLRSMPQEQALVILIAPHLLLRFIGLSFLVPGVVDRSLPAAFAVPAAYGD